MTKFHAALLEIYKKICLYKQPYKLKYDARGSVNLFLFAYILAILTA